jgi:hypothetical protein
MCSSGQQSTPASFTASDWIKLTKASSAPVHHSSGVDSQSFDRHHHCRSVCRCLWLVQAILDSVHGRLRPALVPHYACAKGCPVELSVMLQNGLPNANCARLMAGMVMDKAQRQLTLSAHSLMVCAACPFCQQSCWTLLLPSAFLVLVYACPWHLGKVIVF